jgi:Pyruvate/2-oxoacid:ferredoxin oxidoreductase delta subunit
MKTTLFYFSGTGNCLKIARDLAKELTDVEIIPVATAVKNQNIIISGRVGFVFPVYACTVPLIVFDLINKLNIAEDAYIFAITSCAQVAGNTLNQLAAQLKKKGLKLSSGFIIMMPSNYTPFGGAISENKQNALFVREVEQVRKIASVVKNNSAGEIENSRFPLRFLGAFISCFARPMMHGEDKNFWVTDACNGCGTCKRVCPVDNITMVNNRPEWLHKCEQCFACFQWCPQEAIQCGKYTKGRKRYRNPHVKLDDLVYQ